VRHHRSRRGCPRRGRASPSRGGCRPTARSRAPPRHVGAAHEQLEQEGHAHHPDEPDHHRLQPPEPAVLQQQHEEHVEHGDRDPAGSGSPNSRLSAMAVPITSARSVAAMRQLAHHPEREPHGARVVVAARLREVAPGDDAELGGEPLEQDRHQVRHEDHAQQRVAEARPAGQIGRPVARVHVADRHQVPGPGERQQLAPPRAPPHRNRAVRLLERGRGTRAPPAGLQRRLGSRRRARSPRRLLGRRRIGSGDRQRGGHRRVGERRARRRSGASVAAAPGWGVAAARSMLG
jgi:hypothetical protein